MKKFAVVGNPLSHSLSPIMFLSAFKELKLDYLYLKEQITLSDLENLVNRLKAGEYQGLSVTVPFKVEIIEFLDELTEEAKIIGAANTVKFLNGKAVGDNTDWFGFKKALEEVVDLKDKTILIYGAGGAARACLFGLQDYKDNIFLINRTKEKGENLAQEFGVTFIDSEIWPEVNIFINTTSIGLSGKEDLISKKWLSRVEVFFDLFYGENSLIKDAKDLGIKIVDARKMLLYQGAKQFEIFTGEKAPIEVMKKAIGL